MALPRNGVLTADGEVIIEQNISGRNVLPGTFAAWGTFGSGTVKVQAGFVGSDGVTNWIDITGASLSAAGYKTWQIKANYLKIVLTGSSSPSIKWWLG